MRIATLTAAFLLGLPLALGVASAQAQQIDVAATNGILIDGLTGQVLWEKNPDERRAPASTSKLMTAYLVEDKLAHGELKLTDKLHVSKNAWRPAADESKMYAPLDAEISVDDLLQGVIVISGNDACVVFAEALAGSEAAFAEMMSDKAKELGMTNTHYANSTGLDDPEEYSTARDLATLARHIVYTFPQYYHYYAQPNFTFSGIKQDNRNMLLGRMKGADGLKTGHTDKAGYNLVASAERNGQRLISVLMGMESKVGRADESQKLLEWGFINFKQYNLLKAGQVMDEADVWLGTAPKIAMAPEKDVTILLGASERRKLTAKVKYDGPIAAPIAKGQKIGELVLSVPDKPDRVVPLLATADVGKLGLFGRIGAAFHYLVFGGNEPVSKPAQ